MENQRLTTPEEWEKELGRDIRRLRQTRQWTQVELAERANISLSALRSLELGAGSSLSSVVRVARALERTEWLRSLAPLEDTFSPMAMLRERTSSSRPRRVRHKRAAS